MNKGSYSGRLTSDPIITQIGDRTKAIFRLAVDRNYKDADGNRPTDFLDFNAWGQRAELVEKYFKKGYAIIIADASAKSESWTDKETGEKKYRVVFEVNEIEFHPLNPKGKEENINGESNVSNDKPRAPKTNRATPKQSAAKKDEDSSPPKKNTGPKRKPWEEDGDDE